MKWMEWDFGGDETIVVEYEFDAGSPPTLYYADGTGDDGCPPSVDIVSFTYKDIDITQLVWELIDKPDSLYELEREIMEYELDGGGYDWEDYWDSGE